MSNLQWHEEFSARFRSLSAKDVAIWEAIISGEISHLKDGEVIGAVRALGEKKRKGELKYAVTVEDVVTAIIHNRWLERQSQGGCPADDGCAVCHGTGWMHYVYCQGPDGGRVIGSEKHYTDHWPIENEGCPCACSRGQRALVNAFQPDEHNRIKALAAKAMAWLKTAGASPYFEDQACAAYVSEYRKIA